jgi:glycosyltransferase involved in cell wall biosynthesis
VTRVLFLAESYLPVLGGGERHIHALSARLAASGTPCTVLTRRGSRDWPAEEVRDGVRVLRLPPSGPGRLGKYALAVPALLRLLRERRAYDVCVVRGTRVLGLPGLVAARLAGRAVVLQPEISGEMSGDVYTWGTRFHRPGPRRVVHAAVALRNLLLRDADACVTISRATQAEFLAAGLPAARVTCIPHGVDTRRFRPADAHERPALRRRLGLPEDAPVSVFTGRLLRGKGLDVLVPAFAQLRQALPGARLLIVGSGDGQALSVEAETRARVEREGLSAAVTFTGRVDDVADWLRAANIFAFPSEFEAMPLSVLEAAACGLPCVTTRVGGIPDVIDHEREGLLCDARDADGFAAQWRRLAEDQALRARLGANARARTLREFDFDATVERYRALFHEVAHRPAR